MERRHMIGAAGDVAVRLEKRADGEGQTIVGYGAVFYDPSNSGTEYDLTSMWGGFRERIMPGAFDRAVREDDVRALFNHDVNELLGRTSSKTLRLSVDKVGLRYEIDPPTTQAAERVVAAISRGDLSGSSFSFLVDEQVWRDVRDPVTGKDSTVREIVAVKLFDVGPVTFPAYEATSAGVRAAGADMDEAKASYELHQKARRDRQRLIDEVNVRSRVVELTR